MLHLAVLSADLTTIQMILESCAALVDLQDMDGNTALHLAVQSGKENLVQNVLFFYPDMTIRNHEGETALYLAAKHRVWPVFLLLWKHGAILELYHPKGVEMGDSVLVFAFQDKQSEVTRLLLEHGATWHDVDSKVSPLFASIFPPYLGCLQFI